MRMSIKMIFQLLESGVMMFKKRYIFLMLLLGIGAYAYSIFTHESFGADPTGERLKRIENTPTYKDGTFFNTMPEPTNLVKDNYILRMYNIHFDKKEGSRVPANPIPTVHTDLKAFKKEQNVIVPLGHSSFYMQINGIRILIDPVFASYAAPFSFLNKSFKGTNIYSVDDLPPIDYVLITHDHYDHLEYDTMKALKDKVPTVIAPLGVGAHLELWGYKPEQIKEGYWYDGFRLKNDMEVHILPARHYSSRLLSKNKTLWAGFAVISPKYKILFSGDTGYGDHFKEIAKKFGPIDVAILDVGQFNADGWPHIHLLPKDAAVAATELRAKRVLPSHNSKFAIALHDWKAPLELFAQASEGKDYTLLTPLIGEVIYIDDPNQKFDAWWKEIE